MTIAGWIFMLGSLSAVLTLTIFCYTRVLGGSDKTKDSNTR